jgi:hypothetical protein
MIAVVEMNQSRWLVGGVPLPPGSEYNKIGVTFLL